jgi:predicted  nucleic acid-binding Zn-ribbon protein
MIARIAKKGIGEKMTASELAFMVNNSLTEMMKIMNKGFESIRIDMDKRFEVVDEKFSAMDIRLDHIEQRLDKIEYKLDRVEERLGKVEARLDAVESRLDDVEDRLENIEKNTVTRFEFDAFVIKTGR